MRIMGEAIWNVFDLRAMLGIVSNDLMLSCTRDYSGGRLCCRDSSAASGSGRIITFTPEMSGERTNCWNVWRSPIWLTGTRMNFSSGEARRILIARALVHQRRRWCSMNRRRASISRNPRIAGNPSQNRAIRDQYRAGEPHHLPDIIPEINRVILMKNGRVLQDGPKHEILTSAALSEVFVTEAEVVERNGYYQVW